MRYCAIRTICIALAAVAVSVTLIAVPVPASASTAVPRVCGLSQRIMQQSSGGTWVLSRANAFNTSGQRLCIQPPAAGPGFTITTSLRFTGAWQAYPFTGVGCAYSLCSRSTDLPKMVRRLPPWANTSFSWHGPASGDWNASYDIWLDKRNQVTTEDDGAELMIWLRPNPGYRGGQLVRVGRHWFWFMHWRVCDRAGICWNYLQFRFTRVVHGVRQLWLVPFLRFCEARGLVSSSWWLTSVHAGYEIVSGGRGLTTTWFSART